MAVPALEGASLTSTRARAFSILALDLERVGGALLGDLQKGLQGLPVCRAFEGG